MLADQKAAAATPPQSAGSNSGGAGTGWDDKDDDTTLDETSVVGGSTILVDDPTPVVYTSIRGVTEGGAAAETSSAVSKNAEEQERQLDEMEASVAAKALEATFWEEAARQEDGGTAGTAAEGGGAITYVEAAALEAGQQADDDADALLDAAASNAVMGDEQGKQNASSLANMHRLWLTLDTQHVLEVDDHDHAKQSLVEFDSEFEVHHAVTDPATGKICLYFTDKAHMNQAAVRVKARKIENLAMHVNSSCEYPYCHSARMKALAARNARDGKQHGSLVDTGGTSSMQSPPGTPHSLAASSPPNSPFAALSPQQGGTDDAPYIASPWATVVKPRRPGGGASGEGDDRAAVDTPEGEETTGHRLWFSKETQKTLGMDDHDHARRDLLSEFHVEHATTDEETGKICMYFAEYEDMERAAAHVIERKKAAMILQSDAAAVVDEAEAAAQAEDREEMAAAMVAKAAVEAAERAATEQASSAVKETSPSSSSSSSLPLAAEQGRVSSPNTKYIEVVGSGNPECDGIYTPSVQPPKESESGTVSSLGYWNGKLAWDRAGCARNPALSYSNSYNSWRLAREDGHLCYSTENGKYNTAMPPTDMAAWEVYAKKGVGPLPSSITIYDRDPRVTASSGSESLCAPWEDGGEEEKGKEMTAEANVSGAVSRNEEEDTVQFGSPAPPTTTTATPTPTPPAASPAVTRSLRPRGGGGAGRGRGGGRGRGKSKVSSTNPSAGTVAGISATAAGKPPASTPVPSAAAAAMAAAEMATPTSTAKLLAQADAERGQAQSWRSEIRRASGGVHASGAHVVRSLDVSTDAAAAAATTDTAMDTVEGEPLSSSSGEHARGGEYAAAGTPTYMGVEGTPMSIDIEELLAKADAESGEARQWRDSMTESLEAAREEKKHAHAFALKVFSEADVDATGSLDKAQIRRYFKKHPIEKAHVMSEQFTWQEFFQSLGGSPGTPVKMSQRMSFDLFEAVREWIQSFSVLCVVCILCFVCTTCSKCGYVLEEKGWGGRMR